MDKRVKFSLKQKVSIIRSIEKGRESCNSAAKKLGCARVTIQHWYSRYQQHGRLGLSSLNGSYSGSFKVEVVHYMLKNRLSLMRTASLFGISNISVVYHWQQTFERFGPSGLLKETRGRKKTLMPKKTTKKASSNELSAEQLASLQKEVEYLRAENAFLKKLDALIQQEKAAKVQSKQQKSSRN